MSVPEPDSVEGGGFLLADSSPDAPLIPEDVGDDVRAIGRTVDEFFRREVSPALPALDRHDYDSARRVLRSGASIGLTALQIPERFGGLGLPLPAVMVAVEHLAESPSYLGWHLGQCSLGTLPLVYYGTEAQREKYLPRLAAVDLVGAYALTEPHAGSDALAARTRADLSADGREFVLNGQKAWITNGGAADLVTVFAMAGGDRFTAFLVERAFGVTHGAEERKMGLAGTSTTPLYFDNVRVPAGNVLGEVGSGHLIALNVLNMARLEMGPIALRGAKNVLKESVAYAKARQAFGGPIAGFGAIQQKLADMAVRIFAAESATWRVVGRITRATERRRGQPREVAEPAALAAHAIECSLVKVHASEMLDFVADEGVQIHGGYGFHRDYLVERAFRDARVNRIFEGTNEINRLVITQRLLRDAARGRLPLSAAIDEARRSTPAPAEASGVLAREAGAAARVRVVTLAMLGRALDRFGDALRAEQEVSMRLADLIIETFVIQATVGRARALALRGHATAVLCTEVYVADALPRIEHAALEIVGHMSDTGTTTADWIRRTLARPTVDTIALRRQIAKQIL